MQNLMYIGHCFLTQAGKSFNIRISEDEKLNTLIPKGALTSFKLKNVTHL